jgi:hypothetical protein
MQVVLGRSFTTVAGATTWSERKKIRNRAVGRRTLILHCCEKDGDGKA